MTQDFHFEKALSLLFSSKRQTLYSSTLLAALTRVDWRLRLVPL